MGDRVRASLRILSSAAALRVADNDVDEMLSSLPPDAPRAVLLLVHMVKNFAATDSDKALRCAGKG